jgi:hypothetical protein
MQYLVFERVGVELKVGREKKEKKKSPNLMHFKSTCHLMASRDL